MHGEDGITLWAGAGGGRMRWIEAHETEVFVEDMRLKHRQTGPKGYDRATATYDGLSPVAVAYKILPTVEAAQGAPSPHRTT